MQSVVLEVPEDLRRGENGRARLGWMDTISQSKKVQRRSYVCRVATDSSSELCPTVSEAPGTGGSRLLPPEEVEKAERAAGVLGAHQLLQSSLYTLEVWKHNRVKIFSAFLV